MRSDNSYISLFILSMLRRAKNTISFLDQVLLQKSGMVNGKRVHISLSNIPIMWKVESSWSVSCWLAAYYAFPWQFPTGYLLCSPSLWDVVTTSSTFHSGVQACAELARQCSWIRKRWEKPLQKPFILGSCYCINKQLKPQIRANWWCWKISEFKNSLKAMSHFISTYWS